MVIINKVFSFFKYSWIHIRRNFLLLLAMTFSISLITIKGIYTYDFIFVVICCISTSAECYSWILSIPWSCNFHLFKTLLSIILATTVTFLSSSCCWNLTWSISTIRSIYFIWSLCIFIRQMWHLLYSSTYIIHILNITISRRWLNSLSHSV
jgi:hypothetical protein